MQIRPVDVEWTLSGLHSSHRIAAVPADGLDLRRRVSAAFDGEDEMMDV
jgi:hypothetical protein